MRGSNSEKLGVLDTTVGGRLWEVVTHGRLTAILKKLRCSIQKGLKMQQI